ncbi:MAG: von Willebrand factor type A domain-containing protein [Candidatus Electronema aureum]|uniref:von Willebrand factor type A domain-containing protein n=1 Tax=Candidatus Electronema aureum TaxID=2005002 RepID=A0A521G5G5_9BACT|nr:MAG: von Willebrand factor type A domain-containing protein [Candidatus Electronema aureum]
MSNNKNSIIRPSGQSIAAKFGQKDWVKKLEAASGKPIIPAKPFFGGTVYLVIDCSISMGGGKLHQAQRGASGFAVESQRKGYSLGLIQFSSYAEQISEPQKEIARINADLEKMRTSGSTNMAAAFSLATEKLTDRSGEKIICLVTDGMPDDRNAALAAANRAKQAGIDIMTIGTDDADREFLEQLATRKELSAKVSREYLEQGIISMARLLP